MNRGLNAVDFRVMAQALIFGRDGHFLKGRYFPVIGIEEGSLSPDIVGVFLQSDGALIDSFFQVDDKLSRSYGGMGIGLTVARKLLERMNAEISVESQPGTGSIFHLTFPLA